MSRRIVIAAALASADRSTITSLLAWPEIEKRLSKQAPAIPIQGLMHG